MNDNGITVKPTKAKRMVWIVVFLGVGVGLFLLGIVHWALSNIRLERERLHALQSDMTHMLTSLDPYMAQGREEFKALLENKTSIQHNGGWLESMNAVLRDYRSRGIGK